MCSLITLLSFVLLLVERQRQENLFQTGPWFLQLVIKNHVNALNYAHTDTFFKENEEEEIDEDFVLAAGHENIEKEKSRLC